MKFESPIKIGGFFLIISMFINKFSEKFMKKPFSGGFFVKFLVRICSNFSNVREFSSMNSNMEGPGTRDPPSMAGHLYDSPGAFNPPSRLLTSERPGDCDTLSKLVTMTALGLMDLQTDPSTIRVRKPVIRYRAE